MARRMKRHSSSTKSNFSATVLTRMKIVISNTGLARIASTRQSRRPSSKRRSMRVVVDAIPSLADRDDDDEDGDGLSSGESYSATSEPDRTTAYEARKHQQDTIVPTSVAVFQPPEKVGHTHRRRPLRFVSARLRRDLPSLLVQVDEENEESPEHGIPSDSFIIGGVPISTESTEASSSDTSKAGSASIDENEWLDVMEVDIPSSKRVRFAPMVQQIEYQRHLDVEAVWWTREDRRRTIEEASNEINVYIRRFPDIFRAIILRCQNDFHDYTTLQPIMPVRGLFRACWSRLSREDTMFKLWVQLAPQSVKQVVRLQATDAALAAYKAYSISASRMASYIAQADARAAKEETNVSARLNEPLFIVADSSSSKSIGGSWERISV